MASLVVDNEEEARNRFLAQKAQVNERQTAEEKKRLIDGKYRLEELKKLIAEKESNSENRKNKDRRLFYGLRSFIAL